MATVTKSSEVVLPGVQAKQVIRDRETSQERAESQFNGERSIISAEGLRAKLSSSLSPSSKRRDITTLGKDQISSTSNLLSDDTDGDSSAETATDDEDDETSLPDPSSTKCSPDEYLLLLTKAQLGIELEAKQASWLTSFFAEVTEEQMAAYTNDVVQAVRNNNLELLKTLHRDGQLLNCSNRFGESLLNMACRRGFEAVVQYLLANGVNVRLSDDSGRTPLHDACWNPTPQLTICQGLIKREPGLLLVADRRGCTAFQYARMEHWDKWRTFLFENRLCLNKLKQPDILAKFAKSQVIN